ncbi:MAG: DNA adenine methylase [Dehalococcoidales bacterium]|nr:DNA adenine methylase [Dehalococcoidales bacterium]
MPILSPLRYPGAKRRLASYIAETLEKNQLLPDIFIEPFAGGASVSLELLKSNKVDKIGIADKDPLVAAFWKTVFWDSDWLISQIMSIEITVEAWRRFQVCTPVSTREKALKCLFINRTSFSGIMAGAGPIGGFEQKSQYKIDCRFPRQELTRRVIQAQELSGRVAFVWNTSWNTTLGRVAQMSEKGTLPKSILYYFDPPFFEEADRLYTYWFKPKDHISFRDSVRKLSVPWIISYDSSPKVHELYGNRDHNGSTIQCLYSIAGPGPRKSEEVIITNLKQLPERAQL